MPQQSKQPPKPQHLTLKEVKAACRKAIEDDTLLALLTDSNSQNYYENIKQDTMSCMYEYLHKKRNKKFYCAIGVVLSKSTLDKIKRQKLKHAPLDALIFKKIVTVNEHEYKELSRLQDYHDYWLTSTTEYSREVAKNQFLGIIQE